MTAVRADQRFSNRRRCPICGGADGDPRGQSKRCSGFVSSDGMYAHCSREEHAGSLEAEEGGTYAHRLRGPCKCGSQHGEGGGREIEAAYDYCGEHGDLLFQVVRFVGKDFRQRRPDGVGGWIWKLEGVRRVLYRLPELLAAPADSTVYVVEGEKDVETLRGRGLVATCNPGGAEKWKHLDSCEALRGRHVVIIPDNDDPGRKHAEDVRQRIAGIAASVRVCRLPAKDASDWFAAGHTADELAEIVAHGLDDEHDQHRRVDGATYGMPGQTVIEPVTEPKNETQPDVSHLPKWRFVRASLAWITEALPSREHLLVDARTGKGAMDRIGVWLFGGPGGAGKSFALIALALAVVSGGIWFGTFATATAGRVLIIAAEDEVDDIRRRVHAIARGLGMTEVQMDRLVILPIHDRVTSLVAKIGDVYSTSDDTKSLCEQLQQDEPFNLVVVDPYGRIAGVSVDADNAAAAATIGALNMIASAARGLVLGVTHTSLRARVAAKNGAPEGATGIRGATGQTDYARGVMRLEKEKDAIWLSLAKANHVAQWEPVALKRGDRGELIPLDAIDLATIHAAQSSGTKAAKREAAIAEQDELDDAAARSAMSQNPNATVRSLVAIVRKARSCGGDRAHAAVLRARNGAGGEP